MVWVKTKAFGSIAPTIFLQLAYFEPGNYLENNITIAALVKAVLHKTLFAFVYGYPPVHDHGFFDLFALC